MKDIPSATLRQRRLDLLSSLPPLDQLLRGSLVVTYKRCGRPNCHCAKGIGHGPKSYLSVRRRGQKPRLQYIPQAACAEIAQRLDNFRIASAVLDEICAINTELLHRRDDLG